MGSKTRLGSYCTKRANDGVNLVTSRNINTRLARPIGRLSILEWGSRSYGDCGYNQSYHLDFLEGVNDPINLLQFNIFLCID